MNGHVMISYHHSSSRDLATKINHRLQQSNIRTWIDSDKLGVGDSLVEQMAQAIKNASVVLVLLNDKYCDSANCQTELMYASQLGKRIIPIRSSGYNPTGSVGFITSSLFHVDPAEFENMFQQLLHLINQPQN